MTPPVRDASEYNGGGAPGSASGATPPCAIDRFVYSLRLPRAVDAIIVVMVDLQPIVHGRWLPPPLQTRPAALRR